MRPLDAGSADVPSALSAKREKCSLWQNRGQRFSHLLRTGRLRSRHQVDATLAPESFKGCYDS